MLLRQKCLKSKALKAMTEADNGKFDYSKSAADADFEKGKEYEYVSVGLGKEDDFKDLDLTGKLALIQRGEIPFSEKIANAFPSWCSRSFGLQ